MYSEIETSNDFHIESDNGCFENIYTSDSDSEFQWVMQLEISSDNKVEENEENKNGGRYNFMIKN